MILMCATTSYENTKRFAKLFSFMKVKKVESQYNRHVCCSGVLITPPIERVAGLPTRGW